MTGKRNLIPKELTDPSREFAETSARIGLHWWHWNDRERKLTLSPDLIRKLGYTLEEFDPSEPSIYRNIHPEDAQENREKIRRLMNGEDELYEIEFRMKDSAGRWKWYYNRGTVICRDQEGRGWAAGGITMDISGKYRELLSKQRESERLYRSLFYSAEDPIGLISVDRELILINSAFHNMVGYELEKFLGLDWMEMIHPEDICLLDSLVERLRKKGSLSIDFRVRHKSGHYLYLYSKFVLIQAEQDEKELVLVILRDVTERKKAMKELKEAKERAEESDKLKSAFLANMSHEIRTPMNSIVGFSNLLVNPALDEEARSMYVRRIVRNSELLLALITDIIDLAKIESGQLPIIYGKLKIAQLMGEAGQYARDELKRLGKTGVRVVLREEDSDCEMETDAIRMLQIMRNLVNNAIKFTESGSVTIGCRLAGEGSRVILYVKDTGIGVATEHSELIFDQFRQIDGSNTRKFGGTGLGLAICRNLVELMGGKIWVESKEGKGSLFQMELPLKAPRGVEREVQGDKPRERDPDPVTSLFVMVVDDEPDSVELMKELLVRRGHRVETAPSGFEALRRLEKTSPPDIVFMDVQMPVLSGTETMRIMKQRNERIRVVALSAHALVGDRARFLQDGYDCYLPKPFTDTQLTDILSLLSGK